MRAPTRLVSSLVTALAAALPMVPAGAATPVVTRPAPVAAAAATVTAERIGGTDRYTTAIAISRYRHPGRAASVYLVSGTAYADAMAAGIVTDGPVLLVPARGPVPEAVLAEIRRLGPRTVYAIGGPAVVPDGTLRQAAQGRLYWRLAGSTRFGTAVAVSAHVTPDPGLVAPSGTGGRWTMLVGATPAPDSLLAGQHGRAVLPVPATGPAPAIVRKEIVRLSAGTSVIGVGGPAVVPEDALSLGQNRTRLAGRDAVERAVELAEIAHGSASVPRPVYLASSASLPDALTAGTVDDAAVLLVPRDGTVPAPVLRYVRSHPADRVVAIGGPGAVSDRMLEAVRAAAAAAP